MKFMKNDINNVKVDVAFTKNNGKWQAHGNVFATVNGSKEIKKIGFFRRMAGFKYPVLLCNDFAENVKKGTKINGGSVELIKLVNEVIHEKAAAINKARHEKKNKKVEKDKETKKEDTSK